MFDELQKLAEFANPQNALYQYQFEEDERNWLVANKTPFGVKFLDQATGGIYPCDLVILGAATGCGKTELATTIALNACSIGKKVLFFALESRPKEITQRIKYRELARAYRDDGGIQHTSFRDWFDGKLDFLFKDVGKQVYDQNKAILCNLSVFERRGNFGIREFEQVLNVYGAQSDLIIVDHLNYFDFNELNENKALTDIMKKIRDLALLKKKPILVNSHLRKKETGKSGIVPPTIDDFFGTSNIVKMASTVVLFFPGVVNGNGGRFFETFCSVVKSRVNGGSTTRFTGRLVFDSYKNAYDDAYRVGEFGPAGFQELPNSELPNWAQTDKLKT